MERDKEKDELEGVEAIPREQAEQEIQQAARNVRQTSKGGDASKDELDDVETIPREQAEQEIRQAAQRARKEQKKD